MTDTAAKHAELCTIAKRVGQLAQSRGILLRTAESCTGGLLAAALTEAGGASAWFERGYVCYSNTAKTDLLNVPAELIEKHGAVSEEVAAAMSRGAGDFSMSITGIAGPTGGDEKKPVGTVCFGWQVNGAISTETKHFSGDRAEIRLAAAAHALAEMEAKLSQK